MNKGTLPIVARLQSLQTPSRFALGKARIIADAQSRNPVAQLLRATNETMLGRSLQFDSSAGPSLTLDVSGRRVLRVTAALGLPGAEGCLGVEVLEDEHKDELIKLLQGISAPKHELRVTSGPIGRGGEEVSVGLPVALLADLLLIDLNAVEGEGEPEIEEDAPEPEPAVEAAPVEATSATLAGSLAAFAASVGAELVAWQIVGGDDDGRSNGPDEMVSHLNGFLDDEREAVDRQLDVLSAVPGGAIAVVLGATLIEGHSILCVRLNGGILLGVVEGDGTKASLAAWRGLLG
ncbi:MAG: hypothetical protein U1E58_12190 [Tabrizicola sp.]